MKRVNTQISKLAGHPEKCRTSPNDLRRTRNREPAADVASLTAKTTKAPPRGADVTWRATALRWRHDGIVGADEWEGDSARFL